MEPTITLNMNEYPVRFLGKIAEAPDCMRDATYWTYPVEQHTAILANPSLMEDDEFNRKYACRLTEAQWYYLRRINKTS